MAEQNAATDASDLQRRIDELARRASEKLHQFETTGRLTQTNRALADRFQHRHEEISKKLDTAPRSGQRWQRVREELERDFKSFADDILSFEESMDADAMKHRPR